MESSSGAVSVTFIVRSLARGGAQTQLAHLASGLQSMGCNVEILIFYGGGDIEQRMTNSKIKIINLKKLGRWDFIVFSCRLLRHIWSERPDVVYTLLPNANVVGALLKSLMPNCGLVWGIRSSAMPVSNYSVIGKLAYWTEPWLARIPDLIICNSHAGYLHLRRCGYPSQRLRVIQNGIDTSRLVRCERARHTLREIHGIGADATVVGIVSRADPVKRHDVLFRAVKILRERGRQFILLCAGVPDGYALDRLKEKADSEGISDQIVWISPKDDVRRIYSACDILVSCSESEGFPNVVAEAMSCETPCVVTDVGDCAAIVEETGVIVSSMRASDLAEGIQQVVDMPGDMRKELGRRARERIVRYFDLEKMTVDTMNTLSKLTELKT